MPTNDQRGGEAWIAERLTDLIEARGSAIDRMYWDDLPREMATMLVVKCAGQPREHRERFSFRELEDLPTDVGEQEPVLGRLSSLVERLLTEG